MAVALLLVAVIWISMLLDEPPGGATVSDVRIGGSMLVAGCDRP